MAWTPCRVRPRWPRYDEQRRTLPDAQRRRLTWEATPTDRARWRPEPPRQLTEERFRYRAARDIFRAHQQHVHLSILIGLDFLGQPIAT